MVPQKDMFRIRIDAARNMHCEWERFRAKHAPEFSLGLS
jgi:hypothetical protein